MIDHIEFLVGEALTALRRNGMMTIAAVNTSAMALMLLGGLGYLYVGIAGYASTLQREFRMLIHLEDAATPAQAKSVFETVRQIQGVAEARLIDKRDAVKLFAKEHPDVPLEGLDPDNLFPYRVEVRVESIPAAKALGKEFSRIAHVQNVVYNTDWQKFLADSMRVIRWTGVLLGGLMLLTAGILIYNAIRLTIVARRREIRIMELVGATASTVATPFFIEGALAGAMGGAIAGLVLALGHFIVSRVAAGQNFSLGIFAEYPATSTGGLLVLAGATYGLMCTAFALRERRTRR